MEVKDTWGVTMIDEGKGRVIVRISELGIKADLQL